MNIASRQLPNPFPKNLEIINQPFRFDDPEMMTRALEGSEMFVATYWVRFDDFEGGVSRD